MHDIQTGIGPFAISIPILPRHYTALHRTAVNCTARHSTAQPSAQRICRAQYRCFCAVFAFYEQTPFAAAYSSAESHSANCPSRSFIQTKNAKSKQRLPASFFIYYPFLFSGPLSHTGRTIQPTPTLSPIFLGTSPLSQTQHRKQNNRKRP